MKLPIVERTRFKRVETNLSYCPPPELLGKRTEQHLGPLILDRHGVLGDSSADVILSEEK